MAKAYSEDLRDRSVELIEKGYLITEVAKLFKICRATLYNWLSQKRKTHSLKPEENWRKVTRLQRLLKSLLSRTRV